MNSSELIYYLSNQGGSVPILVPPTRDVILSARSLLQGVTVTTKQYGTFKAFGPEINMLDLPEDRQGYYKDTWDKGGRVLNIGWAGFTYTSGDGFRFPVPGPGYRWVNDLPGFCDRLNEILIVGGFTGILLCLPGDGHTGVDDNPFGYQWLMINLPYLVKAMKGYKERDLTKWTIFNPGFDGVVWNWTGEEVLTYGKLLRTLLPDCYSAVEYGAGILGPFGEGKEQYQKMKDFDLFLQETQPPPNENMDQVWQIGARLLGPKYVRPNTNIFKPFLQPNDDDPGSPFAAGSGNDYLSEGTPRGKFYTRVWEYLTYRWVRGQSSEAEVNYWINYFTNMGWGEGVG